MQLSNGETILTPNFPKETGIDAMPLSKRVAMDIYMKHYFDIDTKFRENKGKFRASGNPYEGIRITNEQTGQVYVYPPTAVKMGRLNVADPSGAERTIMAPESYPQPLGQSGTISNGADQTCPTYTCPDGSTSQSMASCPTYTCWNGDTVSTLANCPPEEPCDSFTETIIANGTQTVTTYQCSADGSACVANGTPNLSPSICVDDILSDDGSMNPGDGDGDGDTGGDTGGTGGDTGGTGGDTGGTGGDGGGDGGDGGGDLGNVSCGSLNCEATQLGISTKLTEIASTLNLTRISELTLIMNAVQKSASDTASGLVKWGARTLLTRA